MYKLANTGTPLPSTEANNPLPAAALLAAMGGVVGFGSSLLSEKQRRHKLRNTLIGATAAPALFLAANKWGPEAIKKPLNAFSGKVYDYTPKKLLPYFGNGKTAYDTPDALAKNKAMADNSNAWNTADSKLRQLEGQPVHYGTQEYQDNLRDTEYNENPEREKEIYAQERTAKEQAQKNYETAKTQLNTELEQARNKHQSEVEKAQAELARRQREREADLDAAVGEKYSFKTNKDNSDAWARYRKFRENADEGRQVKQIDYDVATRDLDYWAGQQETAQAALDAMNDPSNHTNPYTAKKNEYAKKESKLNEDIKVANKNPEKFTSYKSYYAQAWRAEVDNNYYLELPGVNPKDLADAEQRAKENAKNKVLDDLIAERNTYTAAKRDMADKESGFKWDAIRGWFGNWADRNKLSGQVAAAEKQVKAYQKKQLAAKKLLSDWDNQVAAIAKQRHPEAFGWYNDAAKAYDAETEGLQGIVDTPLDESYWTDKLDTLERDLPQFLSQAETDRTTALTALANRLANLRKQKEEWDREDYELSKAQAEQASLRRVAEEAAPGLLQDYDDYVRNEAARRDKRENLALTGAAGGAGALAILALLDKYHNRKKKEISPEEYLNYLEEEGLA